MIGDLERATFSNIEHQSIEFVAHALLPWLRRWEAAIARDLIGDQFQGRLYCEHLVEGLLRGDTKSRYESYAIGRTNGWLTANDIRKLENMDPVAGGDEYLRPLNLAPLGTANSDPAQG
jgi:HK97 family phage portal protein